MPATNRDNLPPTRRACGNCGRLGHLNSTCVSPPKAHVKVGIEVEGLWKRATIEEVRARAANWHMGESGDSSITSELDHTPTEFQTRPGSLGEAITQLLAIYPDFVNASCGMHVHVSFSLGDTTLLASDAFHRYFLQRWYAWGHALNIKGEFLKRLNGGNDYCKRSDVPASRNIYDATNHDRYRQLNFSAYREHATVECRLLPMFRDARIGVLAVENLIGIYEDFLIGGHAAAEVLSPATRIISDIALTSYGSQSLIEHSKEIDLPVFSPPTEIAGSMDLYPAPSDGSIYLPAAQLSNVAEGNSRNIRCALLNAYAGAV